MELLQVSEQQEKRKSYSNMKYTAILLISSTALILSIITFGLAIVGNVHGNEKVITKEEHHYYYSDSKSLNRNTYSAQEKQHHDFQHVKRYNLISHEVFTTAPTNSPTHKPTKPPTHRPTNTPTEAITISDIEYDGPAYNVSQYIIVNKAGNDTTATGDDEYPFLTIMAAMNII